MNDNDISENNFNETKDILKVQGVKSKGYGIIPKLVMQDRRLNIESKAIYSYFCSYAGAGDIAFPSINKICFDLDISDERFRKHFKLLVQYGYITVEHKKENGRFARNIYTLIDKPIEIDTLKTPYTEKQGTEIQSTEKLGTNINSTKINNLENYQSVSPETDRTDNITLEQIKEKIGYSALTQQFDANIVDEIALNILDMHYSNFIYIQGNKKPKEIIQSVLSKLSHWHIVHVLTKYMEQTTEITKSKDYIRTMLYNAVLEMGSSYNNQAKSG